MIKLKKISLQLPGMVIFDPGHLALFIEEHNIVSNNIFQYFQVHPDIGDTAISEGCLLPVYTIPAQDYDIIFNDTGKIYIPVQWIDEVIELRLPLKITSGKVVATDIYGLMDLDINYFIDLPPLEKRSGVDTDFNIENGLYEVEIVKFIDRKNKNISQRLCGYEFNFKKAQKLPEITNLDIDDIPYAIKNIIGIDI